MELSIIIVNHNTGDLLSECLYSIYENVTGLDFEIVVVDNASSDASPRMVKEDFGEVILIENRENKGFAKANNQGLKLAKGKFILLLNSDTQVKKGVLYQMCEFMSAHQEIGVLGCKLLNIDGTIQRSCWDIFPSIKDALVENLYLFKLLRWSGFVRSRDICLDEIAEPRQVKHILGACFLVRKKTVEEIGLLDEAYFMFLEETDFCRRAQKKGWQVWYYPGAEVIHYGQATVKKDPSGAISEKAKSYLMFLKKNEHISFFSLCMVKMLFSIGAFLRAGLWSKRLVFGPQKKAALKMINAYVKNIFNAYRY